MAYSKTVYYVLDLVNTGFVREMSEKDAMESTLSGKGKLYDKDKWCVVEDNPWSHLGNAAPVNAVAVKGTKVPQEEQVVDEQLEAPAQEVEEEVEQPVEEVEKKPRSGRAKKE